MRLFEHLFVKGFLAFSLAMPGIVFAQAPTDDVLPTETIAEAVDTVAFTLNDPLSAVISVVCPFKDSVDYEPGRVKCGFISVPENREVPDSRMIRLAFAHIVAEGRLETEDGEPPVSEDGEPLIVRDDPVAYLTGGPGAGMEFYVGRFLEHDLTQTYDLYILNQRGIGTSEEVCPYYSQTRRELVVSKTLEEQEREDAERMKACFAAATARGVDLTGYNTVENARDVRALRRALGFEQWNVWGISYGSHLGQMLVNVDPNGIRALVLDAIVPNDLGDLMRIHRWIDRVFDQIFAECDRQEASICSALETDFFAAIDGLSDNPISVPALDTELFPSGTTHIPPGILAFPPFAMMYEQDQHPAIPAVMRALVGIAEGRDTEVLQGLAGAANVFSGISEGMNSAISCNDGYMAAQVEIAADDLAENLQFAGKIWTEDGSRLMANACVEAGLPVRDRADYQLIQTDIPTLIINGEWDPVTPPPLAERIAPGFSNGRLIIVPYAGHGPTRSMPECGAQVMTDFFDNPSQDMAALDATCLEEGAEPPEFLTYLQTDATLRLAGLAADDEKQLIAPALSAISLIVILLGGLIAIICGLIARWFAPVPASMADAGSALPRLLATLTALTGLIGLGLIGAGGFVASEISQISLLAGFAPPARFGSWLVMLGGILGLVTLYFAFRRRRGDTIRLRTRIGLPLIGLAGVALATFLIVWDLAPL